jgi:hypothetical protein
VNEKERFVCTCLCRQMNLIIYNLKGHVLSTFGPRAGVEYQ